MYRKYNIPRTVATVVNAICADYARRAKELSNGTATSECERLNAIVDDALENVESGIRKQLLYDISHKIGYRRSAVRSMLAPNTYYARREQVVHDIAVAVGLIGGCE